MTFSPDEFFYAFKKLPYAVREFLLSPEYEATIRSLGNKYGLHVDVTGQLSLITGYMLSGLINPLQLQQELQSLGIPNAACAAIINDLNEQVFKPLQAKVRSAPPEEPREEEPAPEAPVPAPAPVSAPAAPAYVPVQRMPQQPLVPPPAVTMPVAPRPAPAPIREISAFPPPITATPVQPPLPPLPVPAPQPPAPIYSQPAQPAPAYQAPVAPPPAPAPRPAAPPPVNLPGANGPIPEWSGFSPMPAPVPSSAVPAPLQKPASDGAPHEVMKSYGVDPYREPIE